MGHLLLMEGIMFSVVAICKNTLLSVTSAVVVLAYLFLFSGFFVTSSMPIWIRWIADITPTYVSVLLILYFSSVYISLIFFSIHLVDIYGRFSRAKPSQLPECQINQLQERLF
jgi:thiosulfate reductase cytochrome b subunit